MHSDRTLAARYLLPGTAALAILVAIMGCDPGQERDGTTQSPSDMTSSERATDDQYPIVESAVAQIRPTSAGNAEGTVTFLAAEDDREMRVTVELTGLEPGLHGFHVHEVGDCSADDASSAGGHFEPYNAPHGSPDATEHHVGDMGNIEADQNGRVSSELSFRDLAFSGPASILQRSVVIHRNVDDLASQPSGDAGSRVGCGVIQNDKQAQAK